MSEVTQRNFPAKFFDAREAKKIMTPRNVSNADMGSITNGIEFGLQMAKKNPIVS